MKRVLEEASARYSEENIEDWDFRDPDVEFNDPLAGVFLIPNYPLVMAVDMVRLHYIHGFVESGIGEMIEDKQYVVLPGASDDFWRGFTKGGFRESLSKERRFAMRIRQSLEREWRKYGRLKVTVLPPPGAKNSFAKPPPNASRSAETPSELKTAAADAAPTRSGRFQARAGADLGVAVVDAIAEMMGVDEAWSTRDERGFTWWGKDYAQRVWSEPALDDDGFEIFRLHARTPLVRAFEASDENVAKLNALSMVATTSGFLVDPDEGTVELATSMYVHAETADWVRRCFGTVVAMQAADAQLKAELLAEVTGAAPATSAHPASGARPDVDEMLGILEDIAVPRGQGISVWEGDQMLALVDVVKSGGNTVLATGGATGLTAELPFQSETSLLTVSTKEQHPQLGCGVLIRLRLPVLFSEEDGPRFAFELNRRELSALTRAHFLGSWCWHDEFLQYVTFLPNVLNLGDGDLFNFIAASYGRARWVAESIYGDDWAANRSESGRPLATPAVAGLLDLPDDDIAASGASGDEDDEWPNKLNAELFARGTDAYANASLDLVMRAANGELPPVPQFAKDRALFLVERMTKEDILRKYADSFLEAFGVAFRLTWAEEWEDLDPDHAEGLIDDGLRRLREEHVRHGVAEPIDVSDREQRVVFSVMGLVGTHPTFTSVREYVFSRAAYRRLETLDELHLKMGVAAGDVGRRDAETFWNGQLVAWKTGQAFAILDLLGQLDKSDGGADGSYSATVLEGMRLAADYNVDLVEVANSIVADMHEATSAGRIWFPAEAIRAYCSMGFLVASDLSDPALDEAFLCSAAERSDEATARLSAIGQQVLEERGLTPVIDALIELIRDPDAPPASELL